MEINKLMNESIELMERGLDVGSAIKNAFTGDEEFDLYYHACIYYNYQDYISCAKSLIDLYHKYSKCDHNLFSIVSTVLMRRSEIIDNNIFADMCCIHSSLKEIYSEEHIKNLNQSLFQYLSFLRKSRVHPPVYIEELLGGILDISITKMLPRKNKKQKPISQTIDFKNLNNRTIINCYYNESSGGVGDFLKGCCYLFNILDSHNIDFKINFANHDISEYIKSKSIAKYKNIFDTEKHNKHLCTGVNYFENIKFNLVQSLNSNKAKKIKIFSSYCDLEDIKSSKKLSRECQDFMRKNIIFKSLVKNHFKDVLKKNNIKDYIVMHFRTGDYNILRESCTTIPIDNLNTKKYHIDLESIKNQIKNKRRDTDKDIIVMSDCNELKKMIGSTIEGVYVVHLNSQHSSNNPGHIEQLSINTQKKKDNMFYVALDMMLLSKSNEIHSYSVYPWGSSFCVWIGKIFDIPVNINLLKG